MSTPENEMTSTHERTAAGRPKGPAGAPEGAAGTPESPAGGPEGAAGRPESPAGGPEDAAGRPESPAGGPEGAAGRPESPAGAPEDAAETPKSPAGVPEGAATSPPNDARDIHPRAHCAVDPDGRITFRLPPASTPHPQLLLRLRPQKGRPETTLHVLDLAPDPDRGDGRWHAVLEPHPVLDEGRWDVYLLPEPGAERRRLRPGLRDLRTLVDGHLRDRPSPVAVRIPYVTKDGFLALRAWRRTAHAEARAIGVEGRALTVTARLHGAELHEDATVRLRLRGTDTVRTLRPRADDDGKGFSFTAGPGDLTADGGGAGRIWDVFVRPAADAPPIRVARLLDDVADRKHVHVYPAIEADGSAFRPYYTVDNDLAIEVT
ncbi:transferase [Streptomyces sp. WAC04114]|uniref:transferase n=1 Tax=Streptomyces sp. WAC04114 TaxID=2867961 RepID=UPI0027DF3B2B|nr:transferase [Streptomyces sp. WAC04114]